MSDARHTAVYIRAASALGPQGDHQAAQRRPLITDPAPLDMKALTRAIVGQPLRQASHFVELAVVGAQLCLQSLKPPYDVVTPIYLGTGLAEVSKTTALFEQVLPPGEGLASPFDFINAANNMAAFYVARSAQFSSRNLTVTEEEFSFEWALKLALGDVRHAGFQQALVGGVDESSRPRAEHLRRISLRVDQVMGEGSGWLYLTKDPTDAIGEVLCVEQLAMSPDMSVGNWAEAVARCVTHYDDAPSPLYLLPGFRLTNYDISALLRKLPRATLHDYLPYCGNYHTAAAFGIGMLFDDAGAPAARYFHVNRDATGRTLVIGVRRGVVPSPPREKTNVPSPF